MTALAPLIPDGDEARRWAEHELGDPLYREAEPTAFDRAARAVGDFLGELFSGGLAGLSGPWLAAIVAGVVVAVVIVAIVVWGVPRRAARSRGRAGLFDADEAVPADLLRRDAEAAAARADWDAAIVLRMRTIARSLAERTVVETEPGATVHRFAAAAAAAFPDEAGELDAVADAFDDVRYLRRPGSADAYGRVAALDDRLRHAAPLLRDGATA